MNLHTFSFRNGSREERRGMLHAAVQSAIVVRMEHLCSNGQADLLSQKFHDECTD
jgi:hypothetical protein